MPNKTHQRIFGLDVLRAVAIILVLLSHSTFLLFPLEINFVVSIFQFFGAIGVDLFFVLSGFLIGGILLRQIQQKKTQFKDVFYFWIRRWFRTLPNYFLILLLSIGVFYLLYGFVNEHTGSYFLFLQNFATPIPEFFKESWSLSIEEFAYIIGPLILLLLFFSFKKIDKIRLFLLTTILIIIAVTIGRYIYYLNHDFLNYSDWSHHIRKVVIYRVDSIYYGFIGAYVALSFKDWWQVKKWKLFVLAAVLFFGGHTYIFLFDIQPHEFPLFYSIFYLPFVSVSLLLFFPFFSSWEKGTFLKVPITRISILSYGLYLINFTIILLPLQSLIIAIEASLSIKITVFVGYWVLSFVGAHLLYRFYEKPLMDLRNHKKILSYFR